ncbi:hypothetical protein ANN_12863 [Periplaneta americana]|uniref:Uncharacterized protein n=1 Tax=Periplaneta americana TaxID=6978 RepID=A0ABQ8THY5_PERAM|nr:hypothetical protein ANN_12863 [Periplaneta americana]
MAGLCNGSNEPAGSLKAIIAVPNGINNKRHTKSKQIEVEVGRPHRADERRKMDIQSHHVGPAHRRPAQRQTKEEVGRLLHNTSRPAMVQNSKKQGNMENNWKSTTNEDSASHI